MLKKTIIIFILTLFVNCNRSTQIINNFSKEEVSRISILCKVFGGLKFFTVNTNLYKVNWDELLIENIVKYPSFFKDNNEINIIIENLLSKLHENNYPVLSKSIKSNTGLFFWFEKDTLINNDLKIKLSKVLNTNHEVINNIDFEIKNDLPVFRSIYSSTSENNPSIEFKILGLFNYWNFIQYFAPYKNLTSKNWEVVLDEYISPIILSKNEIEYQINYLKLFSQLNDGHAVSKSSYNDNWYNEDELNLTIKNNIIENLSGLLNFTNLKRGDSLVSVNSLNIDSFTKSFQSLIPASNNKLRSNIANQFFLKQIHDSFYTFNIFRKNRFFEVKVNYLQLFSRKQNVLDSIDWKVIKKNILYINCGKIKSSMVREALKQVTNNFSIILDLRSYPNEYIVDSICYYLNDRVRPYVSLKAVNKVLPGNFISLGNYFTIKGLKIPYKQCLILVDENTMSHAEFSAMAYSTLPNALVMGSQTAGADGDMNNIMIPGNISTYYSGIGVFYPDGQPTQGVGVKIDVQFNENRGTNLLEQAIIFLSK